MDMHGFLIEPRRPATVTAHEKQVEDLSEAIEEIFPMNTSDAVLWYGGIDVSLSYKYDLSVIAPTLLRMLRDITEDTEGSEEYVFGSNTFNATWRVDWSEGELQLRVDWRDVSGAKESILNTVGKISVPLEFFCEQWAALLGVAYEKIKDVGFCFEDEDDFHLLKRILGRS